MTAGAASAASPGEKGNPAAVGSPVVVGYDGSAPSRRALRWAAEMARDEGRPLLIAFVATSHPGYDMGFGCPDATGVYDDSEALLGWLQRELSEMIDLSAIKAQVAERTGDPARKLSELAAENNAHALVVGAPEGKLHHLTGSVPSWLARRPCCPLIVIP
ncbi:universal stress protein [Skermania sp. ID1734]|uniref:universal stress protein n=1 Tax=Skermania sp. ID1734 TaxID=2597516 RepID=UPI00117C7929|nr:universal stress protein [Skermania sp. ID1734]TSE01077.1 universal stress protein [Skermania sp. ID1734]